MDLPKSGIKGFKQNWKKDIFSALVVSLIALPLNLGLALASGVPAIAGIITAFVGGIIVSIFGGSFISISGVGKGLAVATSAAIVILGDVVNGDGYAVTLGAIIISGLLLFLFGVFKFGSLSDYFPFAVIDGMMAAFGLIIMSKQIHIMLGELHPKADSAAGYFINFPSTVAHVFESGNLVLTAIGMSSLLILVFYSQIRLSLFKLFPAPIWVVVLSVIMSFVLDLKSIHIQLPEDSTLALPKNILASYRPPSFNAIGHLEFWNVVVLLTLIASVEILLSTKGIERLDLFKRRANSDKDLKALGLATIFSGFLGGVNVVNSLASSSVNANNGGVTRAANLFHAFILCFLVLFLNSWLTRLHLPALAAILVYTGFKLASPSTFLKIWNIGWTSVFIYLITLLTTLFFGLISGIGLGILSAFILQIFSVEKPGHIFRTIFRPNTLLYREDDGSYLLSVKNYSSFFNFSRIRRKLDSIPSGSNIIIDFTLCSFVDETVMEHLFYFNNLNEKKGGGIEIIGLDDLESKSNHPFAPWTKSKLSFQSTTVLTKRQEHLKEYFAKIQWQFSPETILDFSVLNNFAYFRIMNIDLIRNKAVGMVQGKPVVFCDVKYHKGEFIAKESLRSSMVLIKGLDGLPNFTIDKENVLERIITLTGLKNIHHLNYEEFSKKYNLKGKDALKIRQFFNFELIQFIENQAPFHIESQDGNLLIFEKERLLSPNETKLIVSFAIQFTELIQLVLNKE